MEKLYKILDKVPKTRLKRIANTIDASNLNEKDIKLLIDLAFLQEGKDEIAEMPLHEVLVLCTLEYFVRIGKLQRDKQGRYKNK